MNLRHDQTHQCGTPVRRPAALLSSTQTRPPPPAEAPPIAARNCVLSFATSSAYAVATSECSVLNSFLSYRMKLEVVALTRHANRDVPDAGPGVQRGAARRARSYQGTRVRRTRALLTTP